MSWFDTVFNAAAAPLLFSNNGDTAAVDYYAKLTDTEPTITGLTAILKQVQKRKVLTDSGEVVEIVREIIVHSDGSTAWKGIADAATNGRLKEQTSGTFWNIRDVISQMDTMVHLEGVLPKPQEFTGRGHRRSLI